MVICYENYWNTMVRVNRYKWKPPYDTLFWAARRPREFGEICWKIVGEICVWSFVGPRFFPSAEHRAGSYRTKTLREAREGWYHNESLQWVLWPWMASLASCGGFTCQLWRFWCNFLCGMEPTPNPYEKFHLFTLVTGIPLRSEYDQVCGTYSRKTCAWAKLN